MRTVNHLMILLGFVIIFLLGSRNYSIWTLYMIGIATGIGIATLGLAFDELKKRSSL